MRTKNCFRSAAVPVGLAALCLISVAATVAVGGDLPDRAAVPYAHMATLEQYLMGANAEIALARSAAPAAISDNATVLVLKPHGYDTAVEGSNGFTCLVERAWDSPFDSPEFWNPKLRGPACYNPAATRSILPSRFLRTKLALAGHSREQMLEEVRAALARKELPVPEPGAMSFMMSKEGYLSDTVGHWHPHLMFDVPKAPAATWGANLPGSPVQLDDREVPEETLFLVPVGHWSDGTEAPGS